jgi:hypothetical protein
MPLDRRDVQHVASEPVALRHQQDDRSASLFTLELPDRNLGSGAAYPILN